MRKLLVSVNILRWVVGSKDRIDALAFAILIKQAHVNSLITNATQRKLKALFGVGTEKLRKLVADGLSSGFLRREGDNLIANRLHEKAGLVYCMEKWLFNDAVSKSKRRKLTLCGVRKMIETAILYNHVSMQKSCEDTHCVASSESKPLNAIKRAKKREKCMLRGESYDERFRGLSNCRIQQLIGRAKSTAVKVVKNAVQLNLLRKKWRVDYIFANGDACTYYAQNLFNEEDLHIIVDLKRRSVYTRLSNTYSVKTDLMKLVNNR